ncbi:hypothetical protein HY950_02910 [Candidatus Gottesmanbacteria bacterium]|nr:hypothetical protein [Candidatus Gottesmanbacteria bacterium]
MKRTKKSSRTVSIPGMGTFVVGPDRVPSKSGKVSGKKFIESFKEVRRRQILPPVAHVPA